MKKRICGFILAVILLLTCGCAAWADEGAAIGQNLPDIRGEVEPDMPGIQVEGETDLPGCFYLSFVFSRNLILMDGKGNIVWSKHEEQPEGSLGTGWWDFKKHEFDGEIFYSYHDQTGAYDDYGLLGFAPGERVIMDENFNEIRRITFEESEVTEKGHPLDGHDFLMIGPEHYILSGFIKDTVYNYPDYPDGSSVVYSYLQEVQDGKVVWDWKSIDYPELYALTVTDADSNANDFANENTDAPDYVHFNSMRLDGDGNLVCSSRHMNTILCLDRTKQEDQILWKLSGAGDEFGLPDPQKTSGQHYVTVEGNTVSVLDNGNKNQYTRIQSYQLDTENKQAKLVRSFSFPEKFS